MARRKSHPVEGPRASVPAQAVQPTPPSPEPVERDQAPIDEPRRRFVVQAAAVLGCAACAEAVWVAASFVRPRQHDAEGTNLFVAGPVDRFEPNSVTAFPSGRFYLVRLTGGAFLALHRECTHLGCTVPWDAAQGRFACPCHASSFDITGQVISPPAPRPLDYYVVRVENGVVKVDTRRRLSRSAFDASQVTGA